MILNLRTRSLCFTFLLFSLPQAGPVKIWTDLGPIPVRPYSAEGKTALVPEAGNKKVYAFAVFSQVQDTKTRLNLEKEAHVRFLGVHDVTEGHVIYQIAFTRNIGWVRQVLNKLSPGFVNVEPILPDDKISRKIYSGHGFVRGEMDSATGTISARVEFFEDVPTAQRKDIIAQCCGRPASNPPGGQYVVKASPARLLALALLPEVRSVREENLDLFPTNDVARTLTGVNSIQNIDFTLFPPDTTWMSTDSLTGDSVVIGIDDTGIDTLHNDFREEIPCGSPPCSTLVRRSWVDSTWKYPAKPCPGDVCFHGTHVAAIAAGNGWMSEATGGTRYQWRGVAPKAVLTTHASLGDVNNHSHTDDTGSYTSGWDEATWRHYRNSPPTNIAVFAAANQGVFHQYGPQVGYYSLLANGKNYITVGNVHKNDTVRSIHSSMGPTRDGRIKPDIVAPGSDGTAYPGRNHRFPTTVEIDYIRILDSTGAIKYSWEFNTGTDGWGVNRVLSGAWGGLEIFDVSPPVHQDSVIRFQSFSFSSYLWSDSIPSIVRMDSRDSLDMRLRIIQTEASDYAFPYFQGNVYWKRLDSMVYDPGHNPLMYHFTDSNFFRIKQPFQGWSSDDTLMALRLDFLGDTVDHGIVSADTIATAGPSKFYAHQEGTSMAAPHVSGIIALMLDKYNRNYLKPTGRNIHDDAFWNSTAKAILAHTAIDLIHQGDPREQENPDLLAHDPTHGGSVQYYAGPDFATGYGLVNAPDAIRYVDTALFKEDSIDHAQEAVYEFTVNTDVNHLRVSLAWDDRPGNASAPHESPKLINDLDLVLEDSSGTIYRPWVLDPLPQILPLSASGGTDLPPDGLDPIDSADVRPAHKGVNTRDNLEVVDVQSGVFLQRGRWRIHVKGTRVAMGPQDYSLVADFPLTRGPLTTQPDSLRFQFDVGSPITTTTALRASDSTVYFGSDAVLHAYRISSNSLKWTFQPHSSASISTPVIAGNRIYLRAADSLYCIQDNTTYAALIWARKLLLDDDSASSVGDTSVFYYAGWQAYAPAVDTAGNRLYTSSVHSFQKSVRIGGPPPWDSTLTFWDSTFAWGDVHTMWVFDLSGTLEGKTSAQAPIQAPASAGDVNGFFADQTGRLYRVNADGTYLGSTNYFPAGITTVRRQPVVGPNHKVYVQSDSMIVAYDQSTGDSLVTFDDQRRILSNLVIDGSENLYVVAYQSEPSSATRLIVYTPTGLPDVAPTLADGLRSVGDMALGDNGLLYFVLDDRLLGMNTQTAPPFEDSWHAPVLAMPGGSPNIANQRLILASGESLYGYAVDAHDLALGWTRTGRDNGNTGAIPSSGTNPGPGNHPAFDFENVADWSAPQALLSSNTTTFTEGAASLSILGGGWFPVRSTLMATSSITGETTHLALDVFVPGSQPNPWWVGSIDLVANCPSASLYNAYVSHVELTPLPQGQFSTVTFTLPPEVLAVLQGDYADFSLEFDVNVNAGAPPLLFDHLHFVP